MNRAFTPCYIGKCKIENRFVMTAANLGWCKDGFVTEEVIAFYKERARGHVGLLIAGAAGVDPVRINRVGMMQIYDDCFIPNLRRLTEAIHQEESKIFLQLMHAGAYAKPTEHDGLQAVAPSEYFCRFTRENGKELTGEEIKEIVEYFRQGAVRAYEAGFDGVELIGSAGYLISEFLSKATNHREDAYGGSTENRCRFLLEIIESIREALGSDFPIMVRLSGSDFIPDGNDPEEFLSIGKYLDGKVDAINVTGGWHESAIPQITYNVPHGMYLYLAKALKEEISIPVIGCNRLDMRTAVNAIENGYVDMAGILRGLIADPYLVKKYMDDNEENIRPCLSCNYCLEKIFSGEKLSCAVNPFVGKEAEESNLREKGKSILVVGAGIAGMKYAALMAEKNQVTIWDKDYKYGGCANLLAKIPDQEEVKAYAEYLFRQCVLRGVAFQWGKVVAASDIKEVLTRKQFDKVVIATGNIIEPPQYKRCGKVSLYTAEEVIREKKPKGRNIVLIGSSYKTVQTALYLAEARKKGDKEQTFLNRYIPEQINFANNIMKWSKKQITLLSQEKSIGRGFGKSSRWMMLREIKEKGVTVETEAKIKLIEENRVLYTVGGEEKAIPCDMVVIGEGWKKGCLLWEDLDEFKDKVEFIGDARRPGRIAEAVKDAFGAAII